MPEETARLGRAPSPSPTDLAELTHPHGLLEGLPPEELPPDVLPLDELDDALLELEFALEEFDAALAHSADRNTQASVNTKHQKQCLHVMTNFHITSSLGFKRRAIETIGLKP